ncbi:MAG: replication initiation protein RepC [Gaiellales bacterium]|jgi:replication initiation protein RepC|nr:replication initiation protein RepC [Gaiellales bacterium]
MPNDSQSGFRKLTPSLLRADRVADAFAGLPEGVTVHGQVLAAFKAAAPRLGLAPRLVHAIDWLFKFTQPQDWGRGGRPIVWPSASMQREALGLSPTQVKATNRTLIEAGLITMKDSPNGKRYGKREHPKGLIIEAYGFDLSPLAARYGEFMRVAAEARADRVERGRLRRRATIARNGITQILEAVAEYGFAGEEWISLVRESRRLTLALREVERVEEMAGGVESLERRQAEARERLEKLLAAAAPVASDPVDSDPKGAENRPHQDTYKASSYPEQDTVTAHQERKSDPGEDRTDPETPERPQQQEWAAPADPTKSARADVHRTDSGTVLRVSTAELTILAPRLRTYLKSPRPAWPEIVDAADWLRGELGVSKSLWGEACITMGREQAAIAIAIISAKPEAHFRSTPGGYFHGMVMKAKTGDLNLARTVWGLRQAKGTKPGHGASRSCPS